MSIKKCEKCGEIVDEAKAFCPGCGNSLVDEQQRIADSEFEASAGTQEFSASLFNVMLTDMGLNISQIPDGPDRSAGDKVVNATPFDDSQRYAARVSRVAIAIIFGIFALLIITVLLTVFLIRN